MHTETSPSMTSHDVVQTISHRVVEKPSYLQHNHRGLTLHHNVGASASTPYPLSQVLEYTKLSPSFRVVVLSISSHFEPKFYNQVIGYPEWEKAMSIELAALEAH